MKKVQRKTYPSDETGRKIVWENMSNHYRRIYAAKPRVDTNIKKVNRKQKMSLEIMRVINRNYCSDWKKEKKCHKLKDVQRATFTPLIHSKCAESKLKNSQFYYPPIRTPAKARPTANSPIHVDKEEPEKVDRSVQTNVFKRYRPLDKRSLRFLRDVTDEALEKLAWTDLALEKIFNSNRKSNRYRLPEDLIDRELEKLRKELGMPLHKERRRSPVRRDDEPSDSEALEALDSLIISSDIKEIVINSLGIQAKREKTPESSEEGSRRSPATSEDEPLPSDSESMSSIESVADSQVSVGDSHASDAVSPVSAAVSPVSAAVSHVSAAVSLVSAAVSLASVADSPVSAAESHASASPRDSPAPTDESPPISPVGEGSDQEISEEISESLPWLANLKVLEKEEEEDNKEEEINEEGIEKDGDEETKVEEEETKDDEEEVKEEEEEEETKVDEETKEEEEEEETKIDEETKDEEEEEETKLDEETKEEEVEEETKDEEEEAKDEEETKEDEETSTMSTIHTEQ